jgi:hypothetical protein
MGRMLQCTRSPGAIEFPNCIHVDEVNLPSVRLLPNAQYSCEQPSGIAMCQASLHANFHHHAAPAQVCAPLPPWSGRVLPGHPGQDQPGGVHQQQAGARCSYDCVASPTIAACFGAGSGSMASQRLSCGSLKSCYCREACADARSCGCCAGQERDLGQRRLCDRAHQHGEAPTFTTSAPLSGSLRCGSAWKVNLEQQQLIVLVQAEGCCSFVVAEVCRRNAAAIRSGVSRPFGC